MYIPLPYFIFYSIIFVLGLCALFCYAQQQSRFWWKEYDKECEKNRELTKQLAELKEKLSE